MEIKKPLTPINRELDFVNPEIGPVFAEPADSLEKKVQNIFLRMFREACTMSRYKIYQFYLEGKDQEYVEIIERVLIRSGCKAIVVKKCPGSGSQWDYTPEHVVFSFSNPNYEERLRMDAEYFRKEVRKTEWPDTKRVEIYFDCTDRSEEYDAALIPKLLSLLQEEYRDVGVRRVPGFGNQRDYTPPYLSVSFTNPRYIRLLSN